MYINTILPPNTKQRFDAKNVFNKYRSAFLIAKIHEISLLHYLCIRDTNIHKTIISGT